MNQKFKFLNKNTYLLDLGSSPGGWAQVASKKITKGNILAVDIKPMENVNNVNFLRGDFLELEIYEKICAYFDKKIDVVISDMSPNTTGNKNLDSYRTGELCLRAMDLARRILQEKGVFLSKLFMGSIFAEIHKKANIRAIPQNHLILIGKHTFGPKAQNALFCQAGSIILGTI